MNLGQAASRPRDPRCLGGNEFARDDRGRTRTQPPRWIGPALAAIAVLLYAQTLGFPFVNWDDPLYVTQNDEVQRGITREGIVWAFTETGQINWHPLTWLSHMLDCELYGLNPRGHHATSVLLHALNAWILYALFLSMTGAWRRSAALALLFAIHPHHVESVAWVSERKDLLSTCLGLLSVWAYVHYAWQGGIARYLLTAVCFSLALMSKAMVVTLPCVLLLLDFWPLQRGKPMRRIAEKLPLLGLAAATSVVTYLAQQHAGAMETATPLPLGARLANATVSYATYLAKALWPSDLAYFYPHPYIPESGGLPLAAWQIAGSAALLFAISAAVFRARERRWPVVGWCWFLGTLVPVIGIVQVGTQGMADRYTYLPSIGVYLLASWGGAKLFAALRDRPGARRAVAAATIAGLLALFATTWHQIGHWRSSMALFERALDVVPRNPTVRYNVANRLRDEGRLDEAIAHYRRALEATPDSAQLNVNLANVLRKQGALDAAISHYLRALEREPLHAIARTNLASAYRRQGQLEAAEHHYRLALEAESDPTTLYNLANLLLAREAHAEAIDCYREALELAPRDPRIHNNLANALFAKGELDAAIPHYQRAILLSPRYYRAYNNLGLLLVEQERLGDAIKLYRAALEIEPDYAAGHRNLAAALRAEGKLDEAEQHLRRALELGAGG